MVSPVTLVALGILACTALLCAGAAIVGNRNKLNAVLSKVDRPGARTAVAVIGGAAPLVAFIFIIVFAIQTGFQGGPAAADANGRGLRPPDRGDYVEPPVPTSVPAPPPTTPTATVTAVSVAVSAGANCTGTTSATARVTGGQANVQYEIRINGVRSGGVRTVTGTGQLTLARITVDTHRAGQVVYAVLSPTSVSGSRSWSVGANCAGPTGGPDPGPPVFTLGAASVSPNPYIGDCGLVTFSVTGSISVSGPAGGADLTYTLIVGGVGQGAKSGHFPVGVTAISDSFSLPAGTTGPISVAFTAGAETSAADTLTVTCTTVVVEP